MKREDFYLEIGNIDDDLICEAAAAKGHKNRRKKVQYFIAIAACLCLICGGVIYNMQRNVIYYNVAADSASSKVVIPEGTTVCELNYSELLDYYGLRPLPDTLSGLSRSERSIFYIYENEGEVIFDENRVKYAAATGSQNVTVTLATKESCTPFNENAEKSRIDGVPMVLFYSKTVSGQHMYRAEIEQNKLYICVVSYGLDEKVFVQVLHELIQSQKD